jgi:hypothetical protein
MGDRRINRYKAAGARLRKAVVELLSTELLLEFPGTKGFSCASPWRMRNFYLAY